ncbi:hypothetical protein ACFQ7F_41855 [Streptomyces sp. NPDC056486]|uniref:hypothetical protein n=1 Tax=Streptomyces sp. NPDC056486 TaxID=3345835 RepID=UPI0036853E78
MTMTAWQAITATTVRTDIGCAYSALAAALKAGDPRAVEQYAVALNALTPLYRIQAAKECGQCISSGISERLCTDRQCTQYAVGASHSHPCPCPNQVAHPSA